MFSTSQLTEEQKQALHAWAAEGASIADLQKKLKEAYDIGITYMDARLMVLDLKLELLEAPKEPEKKVEEVAKPIPTGEVSVTLDTLTLPGALVSGRVIFSDGETGIWMLDQQGRPGLDPDTAGYRPTQEDILEFQKQLRDIIQRKGY